MKTSRFYSLPKRSLRGSHFFSFSLILMVGITAVSFLTAETNDAEKKSARPEKECFIKSLDFFNEVSWKEAIHISYEYQTALNQFELRNWEMLRKDLYVGIGGGGPSPKNPPVKNEDAMIVFLGNMYSVHKTHSLVEALLDKINQKETPRFPVKNRRWLFCRENRPAYHALSSMGPNAARAARIRIGQEPDKEKRYYMAKLMWRVLGKKFALLYLEDEQSKVASNEKLSAEQKRKAQLRYSEAIEEVNKMSEPSVPKQ